MRNRCFYIFAWLLTVLMGLSSCVSEVEETLFPYGEVKTEFSLIIPGNTEKSGRMTDKDVQINGASDFLGMKDLYLFPFVTPHKEVAGNTAFTHFSVLGNSAGVPQSSFEGKTIWYSDIEVPGNTNTFLMYGTAEDNKIQENRLFHYGSTQTTFDRVNISGATVSVLKFSPVNIQTKSAFDPNACPAFQWAKAKLKLVLDTQVPEVQAPGVDQVWHRTTYKSLAALYSEMTMAPVGGGLLGASSRTLLAVYEDLYNNLSKVKAQAVQEAAAPGVSLIAQQAAEAAQVLAQAIMDNITAPYVAGKVSYQINATPVNQLAEGAVNYTHYVLSFDESGQNVDPDFPLSQLLPDGAFALKITPVEGSPATVEYNIDEFPADGQKSAAWDLYAYPPQLFYFANTSLGSASKSMKDELNRDIPWTEFTSKSRFPNESVTPLTRSIVLKKPVEYAMGNLVTTLQLKTDQLVDFSGVKTVNCSQGLLWTGLLIAGQKEVGWNFTRDVPGLSERSYILYDRELNGLDRAKGGILVKTKTAMNGVLPVNYTLVYPTKSVSLPITPTNTDKVQLLLEFENGDEDFRGSANCLIPAHTRFYIPAVLDLSEIQQDKHLQLFEAGYMTKVDLVVQNLKNAMNTVPDLRSVKTEMGVSVKVDWVAGFNFKVDVNSK